MNQTITHLSNGDFQVDPINVMARKEALEAYQPEPNRKVVYKILVKND